VEVSHPEPKSESEVPSDSFLVTTTCPGLWPLQTERVLRKKGWL
jgi:hypothetical protein